jgi:bacterioferritin
MQGDEQVVEVLNSVLSAELTAINQYFLDAKMLDNWGYDRLGERFLAESIGEMKDADKLIERVLYLEGHPNVQRLGTIRTGETPIEQLRLALALEVEAIKRLNEGIDRCVASDDHGTRSVFEEILEGEEAHADWLETQLSLVDQIGDTNYLAQQLHD